MFKMICKLKKTAQLATLLGLAFTLQACSDSIDLQRTDSQTQRWYSQDQVTKGGKIFLENCASCHGNKAQATANWRVPNSNGSYPPPPLNGSAHTWHHPFAMLKDTIANGTQRGMPAWRHKLDDKQIAATIAWIESHWPDKVYRAWLNRH